ncbi:hypothetical protein Tco_0876058 [Tanacetum coccineum]|uniref:Uncharacterized protein n=1 Tax=Tanacetum coccineum TaxID=301880 RepID=A0ABQ5BU49_9ASTR
MSDSEDSTVTYTEVSSPFEDLSDIGSPGVIIHGYDGLLMIPEDPYAYVEAAMQEPPPPDFVPEPANTQNDDEEEESFGDDADDEEEDEDEDEEEDEEHLAPADSVPPPTYRTTTRMSIRAQTPIPFPSEAEVDRLLAISTPPSSPLTSYSSPLPQIPSSPLPASSPLPISPSPLTASPTHLWAIELL